MQLMEYPIVEENMKTASHAATCTACGAAQLTDVFVAERQPINVGIVFDTVKEARHAPAADIILSYCRSCGFVFNRIFDLSQVEFNPSCEVALNHSTLFREFTESVIDRLVSRFDLHNKKIFEIGCGAGFFLRSICERGGNHGIGIDPTVRHERFEALDRGSVEFIRGFFDDTHLDIASDFICCLSVFEDIPQPIEFLKTVRKMIGSRTDVPLYFEVFNAFRAIQEQETWSIHYEQCNYFSLESLAALFKRCGFEVTDSGTCYQGGQYLYVEAIPIAMEQLLDSQESDSEFNGLPDEIAQFATNHLNTIDEWNRRLEEYRRDEQRVVIWGTGGKGVGFLNTLDTEGVIEYAVEINPDKQGKYMPGSGQRIVSPEFLAEYKPDIVIVANVLYLEEMKQQAEQLGVTAEFLVA